MRSYDIHTNRELEFMLSRGKPLAHFYDCYPPLPSEEIIPRKSFAPYIRSGLFEVRVFVELLLEPPPRNAPDVRGVIHFLYARRSEAWRIEAYIAMMAAAEKSGWSPGFERLQGMLLGYTELQNDEHLAAIKSRT